MRLQRTPQKAELQCEAAVSCSFILVCEQEEGWPLGNDYTWSIPMPCWLCASQYHIPAENLHVLNQIVRSVQMLQTGFQLCVLLEPICMLSILAPCHVSSPFW